MKYRTVALLAAIMIAIVVSTHPADVMAQEKLCFPETGQCISGAIREYWEGHGGLSVFGFPVNPEGTISTPEGTVRGQWFQRDRLEIHPNGVLAGRLGAEVYKGWQRGNQGAADGCRSFPETGWNICGRLLEYWEANGGLERFGLPIGPQVVGADGHTPIQYTERRRMEIHTNNAPPLRCATWPIGLRTHLLLLIPHVALTEFLNNKKFRSVQGQRDCGPLAYL